MQDVQDSRYRKKLAFATGSVTIPSYSIRLTLAYDRSSKRRSWQLAMLVLSWQMDIGSKEVVPMLPTDW